jgi:hypothetical protein
VRERASEETTASGLHAPPASPARARVPALAWISLLLPSSNGRKEYTSMRKLSLVIALTSVAVGAAACGPETRTVTRRTVETQAVPADPVVIERRTVIQPEPAVPQQRVYEERRTVIEEDD